MSRKSRKPRASRQAVAAVGAPTAPSSSERIAGVDALRGIALCLMFVYHFAFDLRFYGVTAADFEHDPLWLGFRALIVTLFMTLVGVSLVLADRAGATPAHFWRRVGVIGACALAVSVGSWIVFPRSYIYFGILHSIAVASVLARPLVAAAAHGARRRLPRHRGRTRPLAPGVRRARAVVDRIHHAQAHDRGLRAARALGGRRVRRHRAGARPAARIVSRR